MTQPETPRCSCIIGRTLAPDRLHALDAALRAGGTLGALARAYGLTKPTLGRHKLRCLALTPEHGGRFAERPAPSAEDVRRPETSQPIPEAVARNERDVPPPARAEPSEHREDSTPEAERETSHETAVALETAVRLHPDALGVSGFAPQVRYLADVIARGGWKDRRSVRALAAAWGIGRDAVRERHRAAAVLAGEDRGTTAETLENTIGNVTMGAEECEAQAARLEAPTVLEDGKTIPPSEDARQLALKYRALAGKSRTFRAKLEGLLVSRVSVSLEADPRIAGLWPALWEALAELDARIQERAEVEAGRLRAFVAAVERLTGGPLPAEVAALVAGGEPMPCAVDTVDAAVKRYEERTGGRTPGRLEA